MKRSRQYGQSAGNVSLAPSAMHGASRATQPCAYSGRVCTRQRVEGMEFCMRHVPVDAGVGSSGGGSLLGSATNNSAASGSAFRLCSYISGKTGRRCHMALPKYNRRSEGLCTEHLSEAIRQRHRAGLTRRPAETPESLLKQLHRTLIAHAHSDQSAGGDSFTAPPAPERRAAPETRSHRAVSRSASTAGTAGDDDTAQTTASRILGIFKDYDSESSDSDDLVENCWEGAGRDSDAESVDSEQDDPLGQASVYTAEEAAQILRDKLIRLQSLYIEQFKHLQYVLRQKRMVHLKAARANSNNAASKGVQISAKRWKEDPKARLKNREYLALRRYHTRRGKESLLYEQLLERRRSLQQSTGLATIGGNVAPATHSGPDSKTSQARGSMSKCSHSDKSTGQKCSAVTLPSTRYCREHILGDPRQVLYNKCAYPYVRCLHPAIEMNEDFGSLCPLHVPLYHVPVRRIVLRELEKEKSRSSPGTSTRSDQASDQSHAVAQSLPKGRLDGRERLPLEDLPMFESADDTDRASSTDSGRTGSVEPDCDELGVSESRLKERAGAKDYRRKTYGDLKEKHDVMKDPTCLHGNLNGKKGKERNRSAPMDTDDNETMTGRDGVDDLHPGPQLQPQTYADDTFLRTDVVGDISGCAEPDASSSVGKLPNHDTRSPATEAIDTTEENSAADLTKATFGSDSFDGSKGSSRTSSTCSSPDGKRSSVYSPLEAVCSPCLSPKADHTDSFGASARVDDFQSPTFEIAQEESILDAELPSGEVEISSNDTD